MTSWDHLANVCSNIIADAASLTSMSHGAMTFLLFGLLLPLAVLAFMVSAGLALAGGKTQRIVSIVFFIIGCVCAASFIAIFVYAIMCGTTWAYTPA